MKIIARHQEGITLNPYEFLLDDEGYVRKFDSEDEAVNYLNLHSGVEQTKMDWDDEGIYVVDYEEYFEEKN